MARISWAEWRPLGDITEEPAIKPTVLIFHTMVGFLRGTESVFKTNGYKGTESTFGLGGPWDGSLDGVLWQWQDTNRQADAQFDGNAYANSVETSDGGNANHPWSSKQLDALVRLTVDWCKLTGNPAQLVKKPTERGLGYHELFWAWNHGDHACPGPVREGQLRMIVIPKARALLAGTPMPHNNGSQNGRVAEDGVFAAATIRALQRKLKVDVDGIFGPDTRVALQRHLGVRADSIVGPQTVKALQRKVRALQSGIWDRATTRALQHALNAGAF